jgi:hypothetical protein
MSDAIEMQARCDLYYTQLRRDGYRDAAEFILELRREIFARQERLNNIATALHRPLMPETDR